MTVQTNRDGDSYESMRDSELPQTVDSKGRVWIDRFDHSEDWLDVLIVAAIVVGLVAILFMLT